MFTTRTMPWLKLGTVIDEPVTPAEAIELAGLDWTVDKHPIYTMDAAGAPAEIPGRFALKRSSDDEFFGVVSERYEPFQNTEAFEFLTGVVDSPDDAVIESAGSVRGGRQVFVAVRFPNALKMPTDDPHDMHAIVRTGHDGTKAVQVIVMPVRNMCMNMLGMRTLGIDAEQRWSIQHTPSLAGRLAEARNTLTMVDDYAESYRRFADILARQDVTVGRLRQLLESDALLGGRANTDKLVAGVIAGFEESPTIQDEFRGTGWGALNALTEYLDWVRPKVTDEGRYHSGIDGFNFRSRNRLAGVLAS